MNKKLLLWLLIVITIILPFVLFIFFPYNTIWSLLLIPIVFVVVACQNWGVAISIAFLLSVLEYAFTFTYYGFSHTLFIELLVGTIINYSIFFTIVYFKIQYEKLLKKVQKLTVIDPLTGVYNRRYFNLYIEKAIPLGERTGSPFHLILIDIDHFKKINDTYGHMFGDEVLKKVARLIKANVRKSDGVVRLGGRRVCNFSV